LAAGGAGRAGWPALAAPCAPRPLRPYSAQRNARDQRAHTCRQAEGEQSRERVNPVAERERLAGLARSLALGDPVPCPPSRQRRRARNCAEITSRTFTPRSPPNASPTPSSANSPASTIPAFASPAAPKPRAANPTPGNMSVKAAAQLPFTAPRKSSSPSPDGREAARGRRQP